MKVTITESNKEDQDFPKLMRSTKTGAIFLITSIRGEDATGIVLQASEIHSFNHRWKYSESWDT